MALLAFDRLRMLWGALDWQHSPDHPYSSSQTLSGGASATVAGGVGVRRIEVVWDRATLHPGADVALTHFDFLNITSGAPDDTWTTGDYTNVEGYLTTFFTALKPYYHAGIRITQFNWYRVGLGVGTPNPAERQLTLTTPIVGTSGSGAVFPPQVAMSLTLRNGVRKSWGRTYLPLSGMTFTTTGTVATAVVDAVAAAASTMVTSAAAGEYALGTFSAHLSAFLNAEKVETDDNADIQRRRRWKSSTYKKLLP